jgi:hypothetical protein
MHTNAILAFDPGISTGVALRANGEIITTTIHLDDVNKIYDFFKYEPEVVIIERFACIRISSYGLRTVELVGALKALSYIHGIKPVMHAPQHRTAFIIPARQLLKGVLHKTDHEVDALAHLLCHEHFKQALGV